MKNLIVMKRNHFATDIGMRYGLALIAALFLAPFWALGQTDYSGTYCIASDWQTPNTTDRNYDATTLTNNYYLCPTDGWIYYKPVDDWSADGVRYPNPFLTTFKCRTSDYNTYGGINNAKWIITKHGNKYAFYHTGTGKYMLFSGQINGCGVDRMRVHLETVTGNLPDNALFSITEDGRSVLIKPTSDHLTVNGGNKNALTGQPGKTGGPTDYEYTAGIIGIYRNNDDNKYFYLEDYITRPTISLNVSGLIEITAPEGIIHYTTDGSAPDANSTEYTGPFALQEGENLIKAVTIVSNELSNVASITFYKTATPTMTLIYEGDGKVSLSCSTEGANIYYEIGNSSSIPNPTVGSTPYEGLIENAAGKYIKAIAVKEDWINSYVLETGVIAFACATPVIRKTSPTTFTITCGFPTSGANIRYTMGVDPADPTPTSGNPYNGPVSFQAPLPFTVKAIAYANNYDNSAVATKVLTDDLPLDEDGYYIIASHDDFEKFVTMVNESEDNASAKYKITDDINVSGVDVIELHPFAGELKSVTKADGTSPVLSGLSHAIFNTIDGGVVKNITLKNVNISSSDAAVGAIAGIAKGYSRIYNCGILPNSADFPEGTHPTVSTSGVCAGGIVGRLEDDSRVINCYSYADVSASTYAAGIVGQNTFASTADVTEGKYTKLRTAVVNNMFYGNILGGANQYGVYGGELITNAAATGISSYNYYRYGSTFTTTSSPYGVGEPTAYNCSFPADVRYLTQVEFHRSLLNSNRELCGWWVGSDVAPNTMSTTDVQAIPKDASLMYKWVVDPNLAPYPILKPFGKYPSVVNGNTGTPWFDRTTASPYEGKQLGTLTVIVKSGDHSVAADEELTIPITDMDTLHYDFGYRKVQLPYFNTVFGDPEGADWTAKYAGNYTDYVVTGWKVTSVNYTGSNSFEAHWEHGYNFADRKCTDKDLYGVSGRVFAQGGNYYVPDGVTAITIEAYWGKAIYVRNAEASYDRVNIILGSSSGSNNYFNNGSHFAPAGMRGNNVNGATIQTATAIGSIRGALTAANIDAKKTVYDYALVLVGNVQELVGKNDVVHATQNTRGFTIMSVDLDFDEEPDYCLEWQLGYNMGRQIIAPIRFDFLPVIELGIAGKLHNSTNFFSLGCYRSKGHFEVTETAFIRFGQFEFELGDRDEGPVILNGGIYDQYCRGRNGETNQHINYVILGGHVVMPSFTPGAHVNENALYQTRHCAVNALGGDFKSFYLTGGFNERIEPYEDNPHCYIDGGRFGTIAAAYKEGIAGDVTWRINHALIGEFYGGGVMSQKEGTTYKIVKGNINVVIDNSIVGKYCGGPKFGDMVEGKTVTTSATGTTFGHYYGAGNGGTNYVQYASTDVTGAPLSTNTWNTTVNSNYHPGQYRNTDQGYEADYDFEVINYSSGDQPGKVVSRSYYYSAQFATTNTGDVTSTLTDCTVKNNFYGAGFLGGVTGSVTSTLTDTHVMGSVYGAGYSAASGTVTIQNKDKVPPVANVYTGMITYNPGGNSTTYTWTHSIGSTSSPITGNQFYTEVPLDNLGAVLGNVTLTIKGQSVVGTEGDTTTGNVFGGGEQSAVIPSLDDSGNPVENTGNTTVILQGGTKVLGNIYGGGNMGVVGGNTKVVVNGQSNNNGQGTGSGNNPNND